MDNQKKNTLFLNTLNKTEKLDAKKTINETLIQSFNDQLDKKEVNFIANILHTKSINSVAINAKKHNEFNPYFAVDLIGLPVKSQGRSGRCWLFAATNLLREQIAKKLKLDDFALSNAYLAFYDKLERANAFLEAMIENIDQPLSDRLVNFFLNHGVEDGGQWGMVSNLVAKYGIVPEQVMRDNHHVYDSSKVSYFLNWKLKEFAFKMRQIYQKEKTTDTLESFKQNALAQIYKLLQTFYGNVPTRFDFEYAVKNKKTDPERAKNFKSELPHNYGDFWIEYHKVKNLTPLEFYQKYVDVKFDQFVSIIHAPQKTKPYYQSYTVKYLNNVIGKSEVMHYHVDETLFKYLVLRNLYVHKIPLWFGADVSLYNSHLKGVWSQKYYNFEALLNSDFEVPKGLSLTYQVSMMNHAMLLCGVNFDLSKWFSLNDFVKAENSFEQNLETLKTKLAQLDVSRWKVENSWGDDLGDEGYWMIDDHWFDKYVFQAAILKKDFEFVLSKLGMKKLAEWDNVLLDPWDPIGLLAK